MDTEQLQSYFALFVLAIIPIFIGAYKSLNPSQLEALSNKDAMLFPVLGSVALFSLYLVFKFLPKYYVNLVVSAYFSALGVLAVTSVLTPMLDALIPYTWRHDAKGKKKQFDLSFSLPSFIKKEPVELKPDVATIVSFVLSAAIGIAYVTTKHWITNNILGEAFSISAIEMISLGSFKRSAILLIGLFFYDIFWVFGTDVMVTVAKSFEAPIKVVYPKATGFSLLGLGDIVIPGIFIALMLRFDRFLMEKNRNRGRVYFKASFIGYMIGLVSTIVVLHVFRAGQPALLYIVPGVLGAVLLTALARREIKALFAYNDPTEQEATTAPAPATSATPTQQKQA